MIGADGIHSLVAKAVEARAYDARPPLTTNYYSYFSGFDAADLEQYVRDHHAVGVFPTHDRLTLIAVVWPSRQFPEIRSDIEGQFRTALAATPTVADRLQRARREEKWSGTAGVPNYFRQPFGPGWALVGDAACDKDPITAQGVSDAFLDADGLAAALDDGWTGRRPIDDALAAHQASRDQRLRPMYEFTCELAALQPPPPQLQRLFFALRGNQQATNQFYSAITGSSPLPAFMNPENVNRIIADAAADTGG